MGSLSQVSVQELKNQTTAVLRRVQAGERVAVTKRGRVVATIEPARDAVVGISDSLYRRLQRRIEARTPGLRETSATARQRAFDRISRKVARHMPYKNWREMDRAAKGDRLGLSR